MKKRLNKGTTLAEVLIACAVFSFLLITLFAIIKFALNNWRSVEDRTSIQAEIRKVQLNLTEDLTRSSIKQTLIYHQPDDYRTAIAFRTFIDNNGQPVVSNEGTPQSQGYVVFMCIRPHEHTPCSLNNRDCPHKIILRVDLTNNANTLDLLQGDLVKLIPGHGLANGLTGNAPIAAFNTKTISQDQYTAAITYPNTSYIQNVYVVGRNIISFLPTFRPNLADRESVAITVQAFKLLEYGRLLQAGELTGPDGLRSSRYSVQVNCEVFPMNTDIELAGP